MSKENTNAELSTSVGNDAKLPVMCRFIKWFTFWKSLGLIIAITSWYGDQFLGWQSNIGYYLAGLVAGWCVSENGT